MCGLVGATVVPEDLSSHPVLVLFRFRATNLLLAVGRQSNNDDLVPEIVVVHTEACGCKVVDNQLKINVDYIWAMGDRNGEGDFIHTSVQRLRDRCCQPA